MSLQTNEKLIHSLSLHLNSHTSLFQINMLVISTHQSVLVSKLINIQILHSAADKKKKIF